MTTQWAPRSNSAAYKKLYKLRAYTQGRLKFLDDNPLCVWCQRRGELTEATVINHRTPHQGDRRLFLDQSNWEPVCVSCHNGICKQQDAGRIVRGGNVRGEPMDPNHHWFQHR